MNFYPNIYPEPIIVNDSLQDEKFIEYLLLEIPRILRKQRKPIMVDMVDRFSKNIKSGYKYSFNILRKYDLIEIHGNRYRYIYLNERGLKLYNLLRQVELILSEGGEINLEKISDKKFISKKKYAPEIFTQSPSFLRENPWLAILSKRGRDEA